MSTQCVKSKLYYRKIPRHISDVLTIKILVIDMKFLGIKKINKVGDKKWLKFLIVE